MSDNAFDGFYTPAPTDVSRDTRWPWVVVAAGVAIVLAGGVAFSGGAVNHQGGSGVPQPAPESSAQR